MKIRRHLLLLSVLIIITGCARLRYSIKPGFDFSKIKKIAVLGIEDYPGFTGTGEVVMGEIMLDLIKFDYDVIERIKLKMLFNEHKLVVSGVLDADTLKNIGKIAKVDSIITGSITDYSPKKIIKVPVELFERSGEELRYYYDTDRKKTIPVIVKGSDRMSKTVEIHTIEASFGLSVRMIDVENGMVIWGGSYSYNSLDINHAIARVMDKILKTLPRTN